MRRTGRSTPRWGIASLGLVVACVSIAACGSPEDPGANPSAAVTSSVSPVSASDPTSPATEPSSTSGVPPTTPPTSASPPLTLQHCDEIPEISTDVLGDRAATENPDPIFMGVIESYVKGHPETFAGIWIDREAGGTIAVAFTDDPASHRRQLGARRPSAEDVAVVDPRPPIIDDRPIREWDQTFGIVQVAHSERELKATQRLVASFMEPDGLDGVFATGIDPSRNVVAVNVDRPAEETLTTLARELPLDRVCIEGVIDAPANDPQPGDELHVIVPLDENGNVATDTPVSCDTGGSFPVGQLDDLTPVDDADDATIGDALDAFLRTAEGEFWPQESWYVLTRTDERVQLISIIGDDTAFLGLQRTRVGWDFESASGNGPCDLRTTLPDGYGRVDWRLDPEFGRPKRGDMALHVLVTERDCVGGGEIGDRLLGPEIVVTDSEVLIAFASIPPRGPSTCPGNPATPVTINLPVPLGDRRIVDGLELDVEVSDYAE